MESYTTRQKKNIADVIGFHYRNTISVYFDDK